MGICSNPSFEGENSKIEVIRDAEEHEFVPGSSVDSSISGEVNVYVGSVLVKKLNFSTIAYAAQMEDTDEGVSQLAKQLNETDLVAGEYEGGFKLWECGEDLAGYLHGISSDNEIYWHDKHVVELGCGHSLPGLYCFQRGAKEIALQDYNVEVLKELVEPALEANLQIKQNSESKIRLFSGDWSKLHDIMDKESYDVILTSDTLYCPPNIKTLFSLIKHLLKKDTGVAYIASKIFYFGVGGGIEDFSKIVKEDDDLDCTIVKTFDDGKSNRRQILKVFY